MFRNGSLFQRQIISVPKVFNSNSARGKKKEQSDVQNLIPPRINRSPIDILKALSGTVGRDPTAFHYQIPDDPFFYPFSNFQKKKRLLALESGRKSARWIVKNNPGFFNHDLAEPSIKTFLNDQVFDDNSEVTEEALAGLIRDRNVTQAIAVCGLLQNKGIDVSKDVKLSLLELLCFYNSCDISDDEKDVSSKWYEVEKEKKMVWKDDGFVRGLFDSLESDCPLAYAALIQGMLKYNNLEEAMELFAAGKDKKIKFPVGVYNLIVENVPHLEKDPFKRFAAIEDYLTQMSEEMVKPNLGTLNSVLSAVSAIDGIPLVKKESFVSKLLSEFEDLKIHPSLGTYYYLLKIFAEQKETPELRSSVCWGVMQTVRKKRWSLQHPSDLSFFHFAMSLFCGSLRSVKLAEALMKFYSEHDHYKFITTNFAESQFFDQYLHLIFMLEPIERSMEIYKELVPSQIFLDFRRYTVIVRAINFQKKFKYLEEIWRDMNKYLSQQFPKMYRTIGLVIKSVSHFNKENTPKLFYEAANELFKLLDNVDLESKTLVNMLITFIRFEDVEKVLSLMNFILERQVLFIEPVPLEEIFDFALSKKNIPLIKNCLELSCRENNANIQDMAKKASALLNEADQSWLEGIMKNVNEQNEKPPLEEANENPKIRK